jgi:chitodextrinase
MGDKRFMTIPRVLARSVLMGVCALCVFGLNSAFAASPPAWQANVYYPVGSVVSYQGREYVALVSQVDYAASGWNPAGHSLWKRLESGIVRASEKTDTGCALTWNPTNVYTTGGVASVAGLNYRARWWTRGEDPSTHSSQIDEPWAVVGKCADVSTAVEANDSNESLKPSDAGAAPRAAQASAARDQG